MVGLTWPASALRLRTGLVRLGAAIGIALIVLSPLIAARLAYIREERDAGAVVTTSLDDAVTFSADTFDPLALPVDGRVVGAGVRLGIGTRPLEIYRTAAVGWGLVGAAGLAVLSRHRRRPALIAGIGVTWLLSLGPVLTVAGTLIGPQPVRGEWLPYRALLSVPGLSALRAPYRVSIVLAAVMVGGAAIGLSALDREPAGRAGRCCRARWWSHRRPRLSQHSGHPAGIIDSLDTINRSDPERAARSLWCRSPAGSTIST